MAGVDAGGGEAGTEREQRRSAGGRLARALLSLGLGLLLVVVLLEVVLRFLPVNQSAGFPPVNAQNPVARLQPDSVTVRSRGPRLSLVTEVRANNDGFRHDVDYEAEGPRPLLALVGDSYVSAVTVPFAETMAARLHEAAEPGRAYAFGLRGAAFPQYLVWAEHAREEYRPDGFVFLIIPNDFAGSFVHAPGYHYFVRRPDDTGELRREDSRSNWRRELTSVSALARYLLLNCQIRELNPFRALRSPVADPMAGRRRWVGNIPAEASDEQMNDFRWAFEEFLARLPEATGVGMDRVLFVMDGFRPHMYAPEEMELTRESAWARLRAMVLAIGAERGIEVADLHPRFEAEWARDGERFDSKEDMHWNGRGHRVAADAVLESALWAALFAN